MISSRISNLLNIRYPILQGGMAWIATAELAAAVSNAGGLGIIAAGNAPVEFVENEIKKIKRLTNQPYGVNVMLLSPHADEIMELILREDVPVITTGAGNPGKYMTRLKERQIKVIPVIPSVALAQRVEKIGADAVIVEGTEAGGHIGELTTMALVPQVVDAVKIPVIAAGGIADGRGLAAAFALGAEGVQVGTRFVCATECTAHARYKEAILKAKDRDTIATGRSTGHPVRILKNKLAKEFDKLEKNGASVEELENLGVGRLRMSVVEGDIENGSVMAGQIAGMVKEIKPCREIIEEMVEEAVKSSERIHHLLK
ncbi:enoyl-[acyl-carrier-protein] reductase FabK [Geosporobacter ferrireducens]|uniref:Probable nitronate monooxygenase n=1 Tax=Geosporobacter ferrireducens TaxID=1424294 RepID=A0A1D8GQ00_9FIRM|nr:enoyl-[acyl-carrier-protein] reductase FabK [Geosporobacter ferrireducens]AOT72943.1 2-nitropropane dioxygenase [Geosporobacter ferrireducens]MTI53845.1 enoyl-[acyl-carrier-protein] reductase FabK [Geosporobacter ferrireducens]